MSIPQVGLLLPELTHFIETCAQQHRAGSLNDPQMFADQVHTFFTPAMMEKVERVVPGWGQMASYRNQVTLIHVTSVLVALYLLPEFQQADTDQQSLMLWMVLYHDVAKVARPGLHDYVHGFRSAVAAGHGLAQAGFPVTDAYAGFIDSWCDLTYNAVIFREDLQETIQDNAQLPLILSGIERLFGENAPAGWVIKGVLLHLSIVTDPDYPLLAPLTDQEIRQTFDAPLLKMLKVMMLVDANGWNLFEPENRQRLEQITRDVFDGIAAVI